MFAGKRIIIFDMDGTLIDSVGIWNEVDKELIRKIRKDGKTEEENLQEQRDSALRRLSKAKNPYLEYCSFLGEKYKSELNGEEIHTLRYEIADAYLKNTIDYKKEAEVFIKKLKARGFTLVIASTTKKNNMDIYRTKNAKIMEKARIDEYFTLVYTKEDAKEMKPHPEIYLRVMRELGAAPGECLIFEDSLIGMEAARGAGIEAVSVYDRYSETDREEINRLASYRIDSYGEAIERLERELPGRE